MKQTLWLLLAVLIFTACSATTSEAIPPSATLPETESATLAETTPDTREEWSAEIAIPTFNSVEEYRAFIAKYRMPQNFVHYDDLAEYGSFSSFVFLENNQSFGYVLIDANQNPLCFSFYVPKNSSTTKDIPLLTDSAENLSSIERTDTVYRQIGDVEYLYVKGKLQGITFRGADITLYIDAPYGFDRCENTPIARLLNRSTAQAEANAIFEAIGNEVA